MANGTVINTWNHKRLEFKQHLQCLLSDQIPALYKSRIFNRATLIVENTINMAKFWTMD